MGYVAHRDSSARVVVVVSGVGVAIVVGVRRIIVAAVVVVGSIYR